MLHISLMSLKTQFFKVFTVNDVLQNHTSFDNHIDVLINWPRLLQAVTERILGEYVIDRFDPYLVGEFSIRCRIHPNRSLPAAQSGVHAYFRHAAAKERHHTWVVLNFLPSATTGLRYCSRVLGSFLTCRIHRCETILR